MEDEISKTMLELRENFRKMKKRWKVLWGLSLIATAMVLIGLLFQPESFGIWVIGAFFILSVPFAFYVYSEHGRLASIEDHFPDFLRDIAEFKRSGVTLAKAIQNASFNDYGFLSPEIKKIARELSWGVSFEDAMQRLPDRVESPMIDRAISIITAAQAAGGEVTTVLETVSSDLRKLKELEAERKSKLSVYTMTIYAIYLLLLFIIIVLTESLVPAVPKMQAAGEFLGGGSGSLSEFEFRELLFHVTILEALFAGLISGEMGEGKVTAGIKHSVILVLITLLAFQLVPPATIAEKIGETMLDIPPSKGVTTKSIDGVAEVTESFTTNDVATYVKSFAKERNRQQYKAFTPDQVEFVAFGCTVCATDLKVEPDKVTVIRPAMLRFSVKYAEDRYQVAFSDANI
ncbi:MAG: type II secretion system F family protein [Candidatus Diapherotrites archaeon]|nr:type II secretion system F family protein [Candidatus Diapherotrites archaeon]